MSWYSDFMRRTLMVISACLMVVMSVLPSTVFAAKGTQRAPKLLNLFLGYQINDDDPAKLARWDIVVLDMDQQFQFPEKVRRLRALNPKVKILAYISASEISDARIRGDRSSPGYKLASSIPASWYLHHADGSRASWWPGTALLNASDLSPTSNGQRWNTFLGPFIRDELMSSGLWDGVFLDAAYEDVTGRFGTGLDPDQDGLANSAKQVDTTWRLGMSKLITNVRAAIGPDKLIMNNSSAAYASQVNGVLFENFPRYGWAWPFAQMRDVLTKNQSPKISAFNTNTNNQERPNDYQLMRYGLTSALIADGFFSFDAGDSGHLRTWWYDEYDAPIGDPHAVARVVSGPTQGAYPAAWSREYQRGVVVVNATSKVVTVPLAGDYEHLTGGQDPSINNGSIVNQVTVPSQDGVILLRRSEATEIREASYINGSFLQVYDSTGKRLRNGFFASRADVPGGATVLTTDVDQDGREDVVWSMNGVVTIKLASGKTDTSRPFGSTYRGSINMTAGQTDSTSAWELIVSQGMNGSSVAILNTQGNVLRSWLAYRSEFRGGVTVARGDLDGDGLQEIVTAPGSGGGPHIRLFKTDGKTWAGSFFAFDSSETGGAAIAVGDVDRDGRADIVVGSGKNSIPRIRVYDGGGRLKSEFSFGQTPTAAAVIPVVTDIDGDGRAEILVPGLPF